MYLLCIYCISTVYIQCNYCVSPVYLLYIYCVFIVYHVTSVSDQIRQHEAEAGEAAAGAALLETRGHHHQNVLGQD